MTIHKFAAYVAAGLTALVLAGCGLSELANGVNAQLTAPQLQLAALQRR